MLKKAGAVSLDLPMAALAAVSVGFVAFAAPEPLLSGAVAVTGLPSLLPAAQPPLGMTARAALVAAGAVAAFVATWLLLRALNHPFPVGRAARIADEPAPLRLRRADAHPDAPSRRPLLAGLDLGEPARAADEDSWDRPFPTFLPADEPVVAEEPETARPEAEDFDDEPAIPPALPVMELEEPTIANLMQRLEQGLVRRQGTKPAQSPEPEPDVPVAAAAIDPVDARLRNALGELQRMAARGN